MTEKKKNVNEKDLEQLKEEIAEKGKEIEQLKKTLEEMRTQIAGKGGPAEPAELNKIFDDVSGLLDSGFSVFGASDKVQSSKSGNKGLTGLISDLAKLTENSETYQKRIKLGEKGVIDFHVAARPLKGLNSATKPINSFKFNKLNEKDSTHRQESPTGSIKESEPIVDILEEGQNIRVMAELPGVSEKDVKLNIEGNTLIISTADSTRNYYKRIELPKPVKKETIEFSCKNGVLEVKLKKQTMTNVQGRPNTDFAPREEIKR
jgi:HSP20 family molecular chaperone IbpA